MTCLSIDELFNDSDFKDALRENKLCLFLGAGVGYNIKMPDWDTLSKNIVNLTLNQKVITHSEALTLEKYNDPIVVISYCIRKIEEKNLSRIVDDFLKKTFIDNPREEHSKKIENVYHKIIEICKNKKALVVQTNYDSIIEDNINNNEIQCYIPYLDSTNVNFDNCIVYLHGKKTNDNTYKDLILTREEYNDVYIVDNQNNGRYDKQQNFLKRLFEDYYVVFLGYSLKDIEILQLIAKRGVVKNYTGIAFITDMCESKKYQNEIYSTYLEMASNNKIRTYCYSTEEKGYEEFKNIINRFYDFLFTPIDFDDITILQKEDILADENKFNNLCLDLKSNDEKKMGLF